MEIINGASKQNTQETLNGATATKPSHTLYIKNLSDRVKKQGTN